MFKKILIFFFLLGFSHGNKLTEELVNEDMITDLGKLVMDMIFQIRSEFCYAMIWDEVYADVITPRLLQILSYKPIYLATIPDYEDPLKPSLSTFCMLSEIRKAKCDVYLIFLANGIQMKRFLKYGDRTRVLQTRAKFILLHDYRLFEPSMHYIWRRITNVVFIRQYHPSIDVSKAGRRYELSTVPFPVQIKEVFILKVLDYWQLGKYRFNRKLFTDQTQNLQGNEFDAVVLVHTPGVMRVMDGDENSTEYKGLEIQILDALTDVLNFKVEYYEIDNAEEVKWGMASGNETTGILGEMDEAKASFALADLYYTTYHLQIMDLSIPYMTECLTFLTPEATSDNSWKTLILPFAPNLWAGVLTSLFSLGFIFYAMSLLYSTIAKDHITPVPSKLTIKKEGNRLVIFRSIPVVNKDMFDDFSNCFMYTWSMLLYVSLPNFPRAWSLRMLTGWYWIYCILIVVAYRASMTAILSMPFPRVTIDTLEELADDRKIGIGIWGNQNRGFFMMSEDASTQKIGQRAEHYDDAFVATKKVADGTYAFYENEHFLKEMRSKIKSNLSTLSLHVMEECAINMPISIGLEKNSPLKEQVDKYIRRLIESGLIEKWLKDSVVAFEASREDPPPEALMDLKKLYAGLVALAFGYLLGTIVLLGEIIYWKFYIEKHPFYDKFAMVEFYQNYRTNNEKNKLIQSNLNTTASTEEKDEKKEEIK